MSDFADMLEAWLRHETGVGRQEARPAAGAALAQAIRAQLAPEMPVADMIAEVRRELALRQRVYPRQVGLGRMKAEQASKAMARMQAIHDLLVRLESAP